jgi:hypothetical protein
MPPLRARLPAERYYRDRSVEHAAQGDLYDEIPFSHATLFTSSFRPEGRRRRPSAEGDFVPIVSRIGIGVVCSYTCGFMAQPPGAHGYAHPFRIVAPVITFDAALRTGELTEQNLRTLSELGLMSGLMYLPDPKPSQGESPWAGHAMALLYRPTLVSQDLLDRRERIGGCPPTRSASSSLA